MQIYFFKVEQVQVKKLWDKNQKYKILQILRLLLLLFLR